MGPLWDQRDKQCVEPGEMSNIVIEYFLSIFTIERDMNNVFSERCVDIRNRSILGQHLKCLGRYMDRKCLE